MPVNSAFEQHFITECNIDTNLIDTISHPSVRHNHQHTNSDVARKMQTTFADLFAVGITDRDKRVITYAQQFRTLFEDDYFLLMRHNTLTIHHYLIFIKPAVEQWTQNCLTISNKKFSDYNLPNDFKLLCKVSKVDIKSQKDGRFKNVFNDLLQSNAKPIIVLRDWINYLKNNNYSSVEQDLIDIANQPLQTYP